MRREQVRDMIVGASFEDEAIKHAVQQVPQRPRKDQPGTDNEPPVILLPDDGPDIIDAKHHCHQAKESKGHLSPIAAKFPAPGHSFVLDEIDLGLISQQLYPIVVR